MEREERGREREDEGRERRKGEREGQERSSASHSPLDSRTSEVSLMVKGKSLGMTARRPFSASAPWPNSRRPTVVRLKRDVELGK